MQGRSLEGFVADLVQSLPPAEESIARLLETACGRLPAAVPAEIIGQDAGLSVNLLRLANSVCYRPAGAAPVETIEDALDLLGLEPLVMLVGASYCLRALRPAAVPAKRWAEYEHHGREISEVCSLLAQRRGLHAHECRMYAVAGLTHDIGRAVIMVAQDPPSASLVGTSPESMARLVREEQSDYGMNHCEIGARIFRNWRFSPIMQEAILRHHTPVIGDDFCVPGGLIFVSHFVTMSDFTGEIIARMLPPGFLGSLELTAVDLEAVRRNLLGAR